MPGLLDHLFVALFALIAPVLNRLYWYPRLKQALESGVPGIRLRAYARIMSSTWVLVGVGLLIWAARGRTLAMLGLRLPPSSPTVWAAVVAVVGGMGFAFAQLPRRMAREEFRAKMRRRFQSVEAMLPHTAEEAGRFIWVSLTAGVCEETLYRGFLMWYCGALGGFWAALLGSSALFGFGHLYQGWKGVGRTGLIGLFFAVLYSLTGSLVLPTVLHAAIDAYAGRLTYLAFRETTSPSTPLF